jgi:protein TonB
MLNGPLKPYLAYSAAGHGVLVVAIALLTPSGSASQPQVYHVMSMNASSTIMNRKPGRPKKAASKKKVPKRPKPVRRPAPQKDPDVFDTKRKGPRRPLPKPSFLRAPEPNELPKKVEPAWVPAPDEASEDSIGASEDTGGEESSLTAIDMPDFPYPWYVTQLRSGIWDRWTTRMLSGAGNCVVRFTILRSGKAVDIQVEMTSGDKGYDYAALSAVQDAAPFPPLPPGFKDKFLSVHFEFKAGQ